MNQFEEAVSQRHQESTTNIFSRDYLVMKPLIRWLRNIAPSYTSGVLVDFGCGNKPYYRFFQPRVEKYIGVDITQNLFNTVDVVLEKPNALPFENNSIDCVLSTQVLEHVSEPEQYLKEISRVLRPGGRLILSCPGSYMLHEEPHDYYRYTIYGLDYLLKKCNLKPLRVDTVGGAWRLMGQILLNHKAFARKWPIPILSQVLYFAWSVTINTIFSFLDDLNTNAKDVANYMLIAEKVKS